MEKDESKDLVEGVNAAANQAGFQDMPPNVVESTKSDGQRLYEIFRSATASIGEVGEWGAHDEFHVLWESFAKALLERNGKF